MNRITVFACLVMVMILLAFAVHAARAAAQPYVLNIDLAEFAKPTYRAMCEQIHLQAIRLYRDTNPEQQARNP